MKKSPYKPIKHMDEEEQSGLIREDEVRSREEQDLSLGELNNTENDNVSVDFERRPTNKCVYAFAIFMEIEPSISRMLVFLMWIYCCTTVAVDIYVGILLSAANIQSDWLVTSGKPACSISLPVAILLESVVNLSLAFPICIANKKLFNCELRKCCIKISTKWILFICILISTFVFMSLEAYFLVTDTDSCLSVENDSLIFGLAVLPKAIIMIIILLTVFSYLFYVIFSRNR